RPPARPANTKRCQGHRTPKEEDATTGASETPSPRHPVTLSPRHPVTLSPCHPVTLSPCHLVTLSPCQRSAVVPRRLLR
ncbi:MAG: hypothetical protein EHM23_33685, partial [Acidobacteria bacterium]